MSGGERREEMFDAVMLLCCIVHLPSAVKEGRCCHPLGGVGAGALAWKHKFLENEVT